MAFLLCLLGAKRLLVVDDTGKKKRGERQRIAGLRIEGLPLGAVLQELDFNPLKSISTVEKRDPSEKERESIGDKGVGRKSGRSMRAQPFAPAATAARGIVSRIKVKV